MQVLSQHVLLLLPLQLQLLLLLHSLLLVAKRNKEGREMKMKKVRQAN